MNTSTIKKLLLAGSFFLILSGSVSAQKDNSYITSLENKSYRAYLNKDYKKALSCLLELDTIVSYKSHIYDYWIGICILSTEDRLGAIPYLEHAERSQHTSFVVNYYLGRAYMFAGRYDEAKSYLIKYAKELESRGLQFEKEEVVNDSHKVHVEKTLKDVNGFLAECELRLNESAMTVNQ